jgi:hypothetical protein
MDRFYESEEGGMCRAGRDDFSVPDIISPIILCVRDMMKFHEDRRAEAASRVLGDDCLDAASWSICASGCRIGFAPDEPLR